MRNAVLMKFLEKFVSKIESIIILRFFGQIIG